MKALLLIALIAGLPPIVAAQDTRPPDANVPSAATEEIVRRGDLVQRIDGIADGPDDLIAEALAPPADDSHKWFITIITQRNCQPCVKLRQDFAAAPQLQAFVNVEDHTKSWAHFNVYDSVDDSQKWRWEKLQVQGYPTLLIQPPRNGQYGDPRTVVFQRTGYSGDPKELAAVMSVAFKRYISKLDPRLVRSKQAANHQATADPTAHGQAPAEEVTDYTPPFSPPPRVQVDAYPPRVQVNSYPPAPYDYPTQPPAPQQQPAVPNLFGLLAQAIGSLCGGGPTTNLLLAVLVALAILWTFRPPVPATRATTPAAPPVVPADASDLVTQLKALLDRPS